MRNAMRMGLAGVAVAACLAVQPAMAADGKVAIGLTGGTLGLGPEVSFRVAQKLGVRLNGGFYDYDHSDELDDIDYDATLKLNSFGAALDWYPAGGGFRLSAGARSNGNKIDLVGTPTSSVEIGDVTYTPAQVGTLSGTIKTKDLAPVLSLGYGGKIAKGFTLSFEVGVMFQGSPKIENLAATGSLASNGAFLAEIEEEELEIEDDAKDFKYYPIVQLGFLYRF